MKFKIFGRRIMRRYDGWYVYYGPNSAHRVYPTLISKMRKLSKEFKKWWMDVTNQTIYYTVWSRDCDMCESTNSGYVYGEKAWDKMMDEVGEWAEGPVSFDRISKEEYNDFVTPPVRDRIMEAFENGRGSSIYV